MRQDFSTRGEMLNIPPYVRMDVCMGAYVCVHMCACVYVYIRVCVHMCVHVFMSKIFILT